jgi:hypothetical protein
MSKREPNVAEKPCRHVADTAGFPALLAEYVDIDAHGTASFCYPKQVGSLLAELDHIHRLMNDAMSRRGIAREEAFKAVADAIEKARERHDTICSQWEEVIERRRAARDATGGSL